MTGMAQVAAVSIAAIVLVQGRKRSRLGDADGKEQQADENRLYPRPLRDRH
jgi:hypothetical protein